MYPVVCRLQWYLPFFSLAKRLLSFIRVSLNIVQRASILPRSVPMISGLLSKHGPDFCPASLCWWMQASLWSRLEQIAWGKQKQNRAWSSFTPNSGMMGGKDKVGNTIQASVGWQDPWVLYRAPPCCHVLGSAWIPQWECLPLSPQGINQCPLSTHQHLLVWEYFHYSYLTNTRHVHHPLSICLARSSWVSQACIHFMPTPGFRPSTRHYVDSFL